PDDPQEEIRARAVDADVGDDERTVHEAKDPEDEPPDRRNHDRDRDAPDGTERGGTRPPSRVLRLRLEGVGWCWWRGCGLRLGFADRCQAEPAPGHPRPELRPTRGAGAHVLTGGIGLHAVAVHLPRSRLAGLRDSVVSDLPDGPKALHDLPHG